MNRAHPLVGIELLLLTALTLGACGPATEPRQPTEPPPVTTPAKGKLTDPAVEQLALELAAAATTNPASADRRATLGLAYEANQIWTLAAQAFENAVELNPSQPEFALHAAISMLRVGRSEEADSLISKTATHHPNFAPARFRQGTLYLDRGDGERALQEFQACEKLAGWFKPTQVSIAEALVSLGRSEEALKRIELFAQNQTNLKRAHFVRGLALQDLGRGAEAEKYLVLGEGSARSFLPDRLADSLLEYILDTRILLEAVQSLRASGNEARAHQMLENALVRKPEDAILMNSIAVFERRAGDPAKALSLLERATQIAPDTVEFWINASLAHADLGQRNEALEAAEQAVRADDSNPRAQLVLGRSLHAAGRSLEALEPLEESYRIDSTENLTCLSLAEVHIKLGRYKLAVPHLEALIERVPDKYWPRHNLCLCWQRLGFPERADAELSTLRKLFSGDPRLRELEPQTR